MPLTNAGRDFVVAQLPGGVTPFDHTHSYLGVGDSTTLFDPTQTDLQASVNKLRKAMDSGYPSIAGNQITFQATFGLSDANFTWNEWGIFNDLIAGVMLVRKVETIGSGPKPGTETWTFKVVLTLTA